jgi:hypothetical protein
MACFENPVGAVKAAVNMQRALEADRTTRSTEKSDDEIHIRVGLHTGLGLLKNNDVFGDVVNAAARVQHQAEPDQILITDVLLEAARSAGVEVAAMGRAQMKGKDEAIEVFAVAWSESAKEQLVTEISARYERKLKEAKKREEALEEEVETAREQGRAERRRLTAEIEELEETLERAKEANRQQVAEELQAQIRFQLDEANRSKQQVEQELISAQAKWELEKNSLKALIASMQGASLEAMERSNNPTRLALAVREQVDAKLKDLRQEMELEFDGERKRLTAEIDRFKKAGNADDKKEAARRALLQKLGKLPAGTPGVAAPKTAEQWEKEFEGARIKWETERDQMKLQLQRVEREAQQGRDEIRNEVFQEMRIQYEPKLAESERERKRLHDELQNATSQLEDDRKRLGARIEQLEQSIPLAQEAVRTQVLAELKADFDSKVEELNRLKARNERRTQDSVEELEASVRRAKKQIASLEEQLKEAKEIAFRAQRGTRPPS